MTRAALPALRASNDGLVVNVTSATTIIATTTVIIFIITITIIIRSTRRREPQRPRLKSPVIAAFALFFAVHIVHCRR